MTLLNRGPFVAVLAVTTVVLVALFASVDRLRGVAEPPPPDRAAAAADVADSGERPYADAAPAAVQMAQGAHSDEIGNVLVTQTFELEAGWNAIYLEVEPVNGSTLITRELQAGEPTPEPGTEGVLVSHELSTLEWAFRDVMDDVESVWAWKAPVTTRDFIVDPAEGLWDQPEWLRFVPEGRTGDDGESLGFATTLYNLHANRGYLVKIEDGSPTVSLAIAGRPVLRKHRWVTGAQNLVGFPILRGHEPTIDAFLSPSSAFEEVQQLTSDGHWEAMTNATDVLRYGEAYLIELDEDEMPSPEHYSAPLDVLGPVAGADLQRPIGDGLQFARGSARRQTLRLDNLNTTGGDTTVRLKLHDPAGLVNLEFGGTEAVTQEFSSAGISSPSGVTFELPLAEASEVRLRADAGGLQQAGEAILEVSAEALGTRWLVPVSAVSSSVEGLWIGEVVVTDVSEAHVGASNADSDTPQLGIGLRVRNESGIRGVSRLAQHATSVTSTVAISVVLELPLPPAQTLDPEPVVTTPFVAGYLYEDRNVNGVRDAFEQGFVGRVVTLTKGSDVVTATTRSDGSWQVQALADGSALPDGSYTLSHAPIDSEVAGYTRAYTVTEPATETESITGELEVEPETRDSAWPVTVTISGGEVVSITLSNNDVVSGEDLDANGDGRLDVSVGHVAEHRAFLRRGSCADPLQSPSPIEITAQRLMKNGFIERIGAERLADTSFEAFDQDTTDLVGKYALHIEHPDSGLLVTCGEVARAAPTLLPEGGSVFRYRLLLRVRAEDGTGRMVPEIVPYYEEGGRRVSAPNFHIVVPATDEVGAFGDLAEPVMSFDITVDPRDPLNPYKHKYHPDHDNLDVKFNPIQLETLLPSEWEVPRVRRRIKLELTGDPPFAEAGAADALASELDWGGGIWGGVYEETLIGLHKSDITVMGTFTLRHLPEARAEQPYDEGGRNEAVRRSRGSRRLFRNDDAAGE